MFGVPLAAQKTEGPTTELNFLGKVLDTGLMECRLPLDKLERGCLGCSWQQKDNIAFTSVAHGQAEFYLPYHANGKVFLQEVGGGNSKDQSFAPLCPVDQ